MKDYRLRGWPALVAPIGSYTLFLLQFLIPTQGIYENTRLFLNRIHLDFYEAADAPAKALAVAIVLFIPYVLIVWFYLKYFFDAYKRLTLAYRLNGFDDAMGQIARYHEKPLVKKITNAIAKGKYPRQSDQKAITRIFIDLLITDIRDAVEDLCMSADVRVAIYTEVLEPVGVGQEEVVLKMMATTEFDKRLNQSTKFRKGNVTGKYEGYCGDAWNTGEAKGGTYRKFLFWIDNRFFCANILDRPRSFLCIPVTENGNSWEPVIAVISIDSGSRYDLLFGKNLRDTIFLKTAAIRDILSTYLKHAK